MESPFIDGQPIPAKLIFNPIAGTADESPLQLMDVINELQNRNLIPEAYLVEPDSDLLSVVQDALLRGIRMFIVCGGDGTIESVAGELIGTNAILGIIPTGTRNNVAHSLGIPEDIPGAVSLFETGQPIQIDVGFATYGGKTHPFLETCSVGLLSALFPSADEIQHGNLARIGDFLTALFASPLAEIRLSMDSQPEIKTRGHVVLIANLPFIGPRFQIPCDCSFSDGLLDVLVFPDQSKFDLLNNIIQLAGGVPEDPPIQHYQTHKIEIQTDPLMPVMADGFSLGEGPVSICIQQCALTVIAGEIGQTINTGKECLEDLGLSNSKIKVKA
jgi:diacylglycerol kinase family enzyme